MVPGATCPLGVDGIKIRDGALYSTNSAQLILAKIDILLDGTAARAAIVTANAAAWTAFDKFTLRWQGNTFLSTRAGMPIVEIFTNGTQAIITGNIDPTDTAQPTAAQLGRTEKDSTVLYATTAGGLVFPVNGDEKVGARLVVVYTGKI
ncbi:hypothetical protein MMC28_006189 [Mycoblastus sanguinarius]|nr:hypothetical protein [Mycoblastus sanguinarius]